MMAQKPADNPDSYDITPARHELPPEPNINPENYDIQDLRSDEDTDDDENPRKNVPRWAEGKESSHERVRKVHTLLVFPTGLKYSQ